MPETRDQYQEREAEEMRRETQREREARFLPQEYQRWEYFDAGEDDATDA